MGKVVRMCIGCRGRYLQSTLMRFQILNLKVVKFSKIGRSLYICNTCLNTQKIKTKKMIQNRYKIDFKELIDLKERTANG